MPPKTTLKHAELTERIIGVYYEVYRELGHGFLESVSQLLNYLNATDLEIGLLFNFGLRPKFLRRVLDNQRKADRGGDL